MNKIAKKSGRIEKEDGTYINEADILDSVYFNGNHDAIVIMDNETERSLRGNMFRLTRKISALTTGTASHIRIQTGSNKLYVSSVLFAPDDGGIDVLLKEGASISGGTSTALTAHNVERSNSSLPSATFTAFNSAATVTGGTIIETLFLPGTGKDAGETFTGGLRFILKPNTTYVRTITNNSGGDVNVGVGVEFYEFM